MTSNELTNYINSRNHELSSDEILLAIDVKRNPQINHIIYENNRWNMWDESGNHFTFTYRNWL